MACSRPFLKRLLLLVAAPAGLLVAVPAAAQNEWSAIEPGSSTWSTAPSAISRSAKRLDLQPNALLAKPGSRLKTDGQPLTGVLPQLLKVQPWQFEFQPGQGDGGTHYGLRPGSLGRAFPNLVQTDLRTGVQTVTTAELLPLLLAAIQEQQQQLRLLEQQHLQLVQAYGQLLAQPPSTMQPTAAAVERPRRLLGRRSAVTPAPDTVSLPPRPIPSLLPN